MQNIKIELKWAIIFSLMTLLWMLIEKLSGLHAAHINLHMYLTNLYAIPAITVMTLALLDKKRNFYNQQISYKQGLLSGIVLSLIIALLSPLTQAITTYLITPEYFPNAINYSVKMGYYPTTALAEAQFNFKTYALQGLMGALIMGIVTTAIAMLVVRTKTKA
jgi:hypothetical protein